MGERTAPLPGDHISPLRDHTAKGNATMKRFAPLTLLFGMLTALLLGSASIAQAGPLLDTDFNCNNVVGVSVVCQSDVLNNLGVDIGDVTVNIGDVNTLNNNQIVYLEDSLNNINVDILNPETYIGNLEVEVLNVYNNEFNIPIDVDDVAVCVTVGLVKTCQ